MAYIASPALHRRKRSGLIKCHSRRRVCIVCGTPGIVLVVPKAACNAAAKALALPDTTSRSYTNNYQPTGCYMYKSGSYHDLRYNTKGRTTSTSRYYLSICLNTVKETKKCPGDADGNKKTDVEDLLELLGTYGKTGSGLKADFKADKKIDVEDLLILLGNYGKKC